MCNLHGEYTELSKSGLQVAHAYLQAESTPAGRLDDGTAVAQVPSIYTCTVSGVLGMPTLLYVLLCGDLS